jgi:hypothetical protein
VAARKLYAQMKAFYIKAQEVIKSRDVADIEACLANAEEAGVDLFILKQVLELHTFLGEEKRLIAMIESACKEDALDPLQEAVKQDDAFRTTYAQYEASPAYDAAMTQCKEQIAVLIAKQKARDALQAAVISEELQPLRDALAEAKEVKLTEPEMQEAATLLERLEKEEALFQEFAKIVESEDVKQIEAGLLTIKDIPIDEARRAVVQKAKEFIKTKFSADIDAAIEADDLKVLESELVPACEERGFGVLVETANKAIDALFEKWCAAAIEADDVAKMEGELTEQLQARKPKYEQLLKKLELAVLQIFSTRVREAVAASDEKLIVETLLPALKERDFDELIDVAEEFVQKEEERRAREAEMKRLEEERKKKEEEERVARAAARKAEEERLAKERENLAEEERARLEAEDKARVEAEEKQLEAKLEEERTAREAEFQEKLEAERQDDAAGVDELEAG